MRIYVTQRRIDMAKYWDTVGAPRTSTCPIALAIREKLNLPMTAVSVGRDRITIRGQSWALGRKERAFISRPDSDAEVEPCVLEVGP